MSDEMWKGIEDALKKEDPELATTLLAPTALDAYDDKKSKKTPAPEPQPSKIIVNKEKTAFDKNSTINTGMSGRDYLRSINAKCMATSENFYTCATVESFSGAANNHDGVLLGIDEIDKGHKCWRVYDPPTTTFVCATSKRNAHLGIVKERNSQLARSLAGKIDTQPPGYRATPSTFVRD